MRDADQPTVIPVSPAVIGASEGGGIAGIGAAQAVAAMAAKVQEGAGLACTVAYHQYRVFAHMRGKEVAGPWDLAFVAQKKPTPGEDLAPPPRIGMRKSVKSRENLRYNYPLWIPCPKRRRASSSAVSGSCRIAAKFLPTAGR